jgi:hypothetical protein
MVLFHNVAAHPAQEQNHGRHDAGQPDQHFKHRQIAVK